MPRTPPTIVAPLPNDPRVFALAKAAGLTTREAFSCAAECWAWVSVMSVDDIVVNTAPDSLDAVVDVPGFGQAMLKAGLVGTVDGGLVLPAELRRRGRDQRDGRAAAAAEDQGDKAERKRKQARIRQRRLRATKTLQPVTRDTSVTPTGTDTAMKRTPRRLGTVEGFPVMLLFSRAGVPFYKLAGASPKEWTGTVTDPENPSYADALVSLHAAIKRKDGNGFGGGDSFRPSLKAVVAEAERYRAERASAAADDARCDEANRAAAEAAAEDQGDIDHEPAERDCHADVTPDQRDTVTVTEVSRSESVTCPPNSSEGSDLRNAVCHAPVTVTAPSSSSSSVSLGNEDKENTTTTKPVTPAERDHEDSILDRFFDRFLDRHVPRKDPVATEQEKRWREMAERFAAGLNVTVESIFHQWGNEKDILRARLEAAGIDPATGFPVAAGAPHEPAAARDDITVTTEPAGRSRPQAGSVDAQGDDEASDDLDAIRDRILEQLRQSAMTAADIGVTAS